MGDNQSRIPSAKKTGGPRRYEIREVVSAVFYTSRGGCSWRMLPNDFPPWKSGVLQGMEEKRSLAEDS